MNNVLDIDTESCYSSAERKAARYFSALYELVKSKNYASALKEDFKQWGQKHKSSRSWLSWLTGYNRQSRSATQGQRYIEWLEKAGRLDDYLDRSVSYIYLRDLGKRLNQPATQARIRTITADVKRMLLHSKADDQGQLLEFISLEKVYRWAQKEQVELAVIWVIGKLKQVADHLPAEMNAEHAQRKLIKIIVGVVMHAIEEMDEAVPPAERSQILDEAIRLGYCYGLTYPFIDDLLDSKALTEQEKLDYAELLRAALSTGIVPDLEKWTGADNPALKFIHTELSEAFQYVKNVQRSETERLFLEQAYVFFHAQELDRTKQMSNKAYSNEELYIPIILKSASSRLIARSVLRAKEDEEFDRQTFYYGIYNQLADDFADMLDDKAAGAVTPYTYFLTYHEERTDLINPFELYWAVIAYLLHHVYHSDEKTRDVMLGRAIGGLKRFKSKHGAEQFTSLMNSLFVGSDDFKLQIIQLVDKADDVDFLDKLIRDQLVDMLKNEQQQKQAFSEMIQRAREQFNAALLLEAKEVMLPVKQMLYDAANYSLEGGGKRLRPIMSWVMGTQEYGLSDVALMPVLRSLEYMHTASLIIDDLPTQDNAATRRGRPTLHMLHNSATAELTSLLLIQRAIYEQSSLYSFDSTIVLKMMRYSSQKAEELCIGQAMDLSSKGKSLTLQQLNEICYYKTAIAFEAALVMPAILAQVDETEIAALKAYAYHAGIAFQIKDDLLDSSGDASLLGKPVGLDIRNNTSTFVTVLGYEGAQKVMWEHYCSATDALKQLRPRTMFLKYLLDYIVHRNQ